MRVKVTAVSAVTTLLLVGCAGSSAGPQDTTPRSSESSIEASGQPGWTQLPDGPLSPRWGATAVWADGALLVFGGRDTDPCPPGADCALPAEPPRRDGARYDPDRQSWSAMAPLPVDVEYGSTAVLDGVVYVWGHARPGEDWTTTFLAYDLEADQWAQLPLPTTTDLRGYELEEGNGEVLLSVGSHENGRHPDLRYLPEQRTFAELPADPLAPSFDRDLTVVGDMIVLTGIPISPSPGGADGPARYQAAVLTSTEGWRELPPGDVIGHNPEWFAVDGVLVNPMPGGSDGGQTNTYDRVYPFGGRLDPATGEWSTLPEAPDADSDALRLYGVGDDQLLLSGHGLGFQPLHGRWIDLGAPEQLPDHGIAGAVGDGQLYVFGGAHWENGTQARLSATTWLFAPPAPGEDLSNPEPVADHPDAAVRAGAAGQQVACEGAVHLGGWAADFGGPHEGAADPQGALEAFLDQGLFGLPTTGYELTSSQDDRALFTYEVDDAAKVAVIVVDGAAEPTLGVSDGWVIETFATCDPAEYAATTDDELRQTVWTDRNGERISTSTVTSFQGHEHCGWQSVTFLHLDGQRQYLRDPDHLLTEQTVVAYDGDVQLPEDAADTGYRHGDRQLWLAADETVAYMVTETNVEAWPATSEQVGCR